MKIQNFMVLFVIIVLPIIIVASYYMSLQIDTINMQTSYNSKLIESTKEAISSYEINTVEWNPDYYAVSDSRRRDIMASINTFTKAFANSIGVGGASQETILPYIPAIAYTLYDGYYIYSPAETRITIKNQNEVAVSMQKSLIKDGTIVLKSDYKEEDEGKILYEPKDASSGIDGTYNGKQFTLDPSKAKTEYKHILKPFSAYSKSYNGTINGSNVDLVVNYTLDNYVKIYGKIEKENEEATEYEYVSKEGYLTDTTKINGITTGGTVAGISFNNRSMLPEILMENVVYYTEYNPTFTRVDDVPYVYTKDKQKVYFKDIDNDTKEDIFFINSKNKAEKIAGSYYKKLTIPRKVGSNISYTEIYQDLTDGTWYRRKNNDLDIADNNREKIDESDLKKYLGDVDATNSNTLKKDYSAINYCVESYVFSLWVKGLNIKDDSNQEIFGGDPEIETSLFNQERREVIKETLISNLNQAITSYSSNTEGEYQLPVLSETDWDQILSNVSIVTFLQNIPIGMKYYNNYSIATSTKNKEYVDPNEIYLQADNDKYYHRPYCKHLSSSNIIGYRNIDYVEKSFEKSSDETEYYYLHGKTNTAEASCYYCMVQRDLYEKTPNVDVQEKAYYTALARERYAARITKLPQEAESSYWIKAITNEAGKGKIYIDVNNSGTPINGIGSVSKKIEKNIGYTYTVYGETSNINNTGETIEPETNEVYDVQDGALGPRSSYTTNDKIEIMVSGYDYNGVTINYNVVSGNPNYGAGRNRFLWKRNIYKFRRRKWKCKCTIKLYK